jgi:hypothetical protein
MPGRHDRPRRGICLVALMFPIIVSMVRPPPISTSFQGRHGLPLWVGVPVLAGVIAATAAQFSAFVTLGWRFGLPVGGRGGT